MERVPTAEQHYSSLKSDEKKATFFMASAGSRLQIRAKTSIIFTFTAALWS